MALPPHTRHGFYAKTHPIAHALDGLAASWRPFSMLFAAQFVNYGFIAWNYRMIAQAHYGSIFVSDIACASLSWFLIRRVAKEDSMAGFYGFALGGACGAVVSTVITKMVYGQ